MKPKTENFDTTCHLFNLEFAKRYGVFASILIYDIDYWIAHNKANAKHCIDGKTWTYNSAHAFTSLFPYLTTYQIKHTLKKLCEDRVLMKEQFRKKQYDHSNWYTFTDEFLKKFTPLLRCCRQKITPSDTIEATPEAPETRLVEFPQSADLLCPISTNSVNSASRPETTDPLPSLSGHQQSTTLLQGEQKKQKSEKQQTYQQHQQSSSAAVPQRNAEDDVSKKARKDGKRKDGKQVSDPDVEKRDLKGSIVLLNNSGFGGVNAALVLRK